MEDWRQPSFSNRVVLDSQDNIYVDGFGPGVNFIADKHSPDGTKLWSTTFGHPTINESVNWLAVDSNNDLILTGHMAGATGGLLTVKFSADGAVLWSDIQNVNSGEAYRVEVDAARNVYVLGVTFDGFSNYDFYLVKYDPDGALLWTRQKTFGPTSFDVPSALSVSPEGRVAATGQVGSNDFGTVVYDTDGNELFASVYPDGLGGAEDVLVAPDDTVYVCGMNVQSLGVVVRYDPLGNEMWATEVGGGPIWWARFNRLALDSAGNLIAAGYGNAPASSFMDWLVAKLDPSGAEVWSRTHGNYVTADEWIRAVTTGPSDEIYVAGSAGVPGCSPSSSGFGTAVIRYDADGDLGWLHEAACSSSSPNSIAVDSACGIVLNTGQGEIIRLVQESEASLYCVAKVASPGCLPTLGFNGSPSLSAVQPFEIRVDSVVNNKSGIFFYGLQGPANSPFLGGTLCVQPPLVRTAVMNSTGNPPPDDCSGSLVFDFQAHALGGTNPLLGAGSTVHGQFWFRDPQGSFGVGLSDAISFQLCP